MDVPGVWCDKFGNEYQPATIKDVLHAPNQNFNMFSISKALMSGWMLSGDREGIMLTKGDATIKFDIRIETRRGALFCGYFKRRQEVGAGSTESGAVFPIAKVHQILGHGGEDDARKTAKALGWRITRGSLAPCEACTIAKAKQKNVCKESSGEKASKVGERMYLDQSVIRAPDGVEINVTDKNWRIIVDELSEYKESHFYESKNGMIEPTCAIFNKWTQGGKEIKFLRQDNAGENKKLIERANSADWKLNLTPEYTGRGTPQRNHLAELGFSTIAKKGRAMMVAANLPVDIKYRLCKQAFRTATMLDNLAVKEVDGKVLTRYEHFHGKYPWYAKALRTFGEAGTVKVGKHGKVGNRGEPMVFVGYADDHQDDCYRMWNPTTGRVVETRDIIWLCRMFYPKTDGAPELTSDPLVAFEVPEGTPTQTAEQEAREGETSITDEIASAPPAKQVSFEEGDADDSQGFERVTTRSGRVVNRGVLPYDNQLTGVSAVSAAETNYFAALSELDNYEFEVMAVGAGIGGGFGHTSELQVMNFKQAMKSQDAEAWKVEVENEHERMTTRHNVWEPVKRSDVPSGAKILDSTWAMKKKSNGKLRGRLNARGFRQEEGEHYDGSSIASPVTNNATIRIALTIMLLGGMAARVLDVRGAFLNGRFEDGESLYMKVPEGMEHHYEKDDVLKLKRPIYGLKQAAMCFWRDLLRAMKSMGHERSKADPCLYFSWVAGVLVMWLSWIDDNLCISKPEQVEIEAKKLADRYDVDDLGVMDEYVGCKTDLDVEDRSLKFTQPVILQSFIDEFGIGKDKPVTPMIPGTVLTKCNPENALSPSRQTKYRSGVGKLLYMAGWSRPDIQYAVRELSKHMMQADEGHFKAMERCMSYVVATPNRGLLLKPEGSWDGTQENAVFNIRGRSDSDYAKCPDTRRSVTGCRTFLNGSPITFRSATQKTVSLSVTESEGSAGVTCVQDMLYTKKVVESMGMKVELPMILEMDNKGAVDLANNWSVGGRTRHVEVRNHFMRELKEQGILKIVWISTDDNDADLFTKSLPGPAFAKHAAVFCGRDDYYPSSET